MISEAPFGLIESNFQAKWGKLVKEWANLNNFYFDAWGDVPAWHGENCNSAMLAAAAWKLGLPAACESTIVKARQTGMRGRPVSYNGRSDIFICGELPLYVEAKALHLKIGKESKYSLGHDFIPRALERACKNATQGNSYAKKLDASIVGAVFFSVAFHDDYYGPGKTWERRRKIFDQELESFRDKLNERKLKAPFGSARHAVFFNEASDLPWDDNSQHGKIRLAAFGLCAAAKDDNWTL